MENLIQSLLLENESVELPGLGVFKKRFRSAHVDAEELIHPPSSKPTFTLDKSVRGKDLVGAIAVANNLSTEDAGIKLKEYVGKINATLESNGSYSFDGLGTLLKFSSGKVDFAPSKGSNFFLETLGFAAIRLPKEVVDINTQAKTEANSKREINQQIFEQKADPTVQDKVAAAKSVTPTPKPVVNKTEQPSLNQSAKEDPKTVRDDLMRTLEEKKMAAAEKSGITTPIKSVSPTNEIKQAEPKPLEAKVAKVESTAPLKVEKPIPVKKTTPVKKVEQPVLKKEPKPIEKAAPKVNPTPKRATVQPAKKRSVFALLLPLLFLFLAAFGLFKFFGSDKAAEAAVVTDQVVSNEAPAATSKATTQEPVETETTSETEALTESATTEAKPAPKKEKPVAKTNNTSSASTGKLKKGYYIIVGAFGQPSNANKVVNALNQKGYDAAIVTRGRLNQVGAFATESMDEAKGLQSELINAGYRDAWIMNRK